VKFHNVIRGQIVEIQPEKTRGKVIDLAPNEQVRVQIDGMGGYLLVLAKNLKLISDSAADLANSAEKRFQTNFLKQFKETTKAFRESSVQKKKKAKPKLK
jgi:hypothetical protein